MIKQLSKEQQLKTWVFVILATLVFTFWFLNPYLNVIAFAGLVAIIFNPIYKWFLRFKRAKISKGFAAGLTTIISFFIFLVPILIVFGVTVNQAVVLFNNFEDGTLIIDGQGINDVLLDVTEWADQQVVGLGGSSDLIKPTEATDKLKEVVPIIGNYMINLVRSIATGIPNMIAMVIIYLFVFIGILTNQDQLLEVLHNLSPFGKEQNDDYFTKITATAKAMVKGQLLIAFLQGLVGAGSLFLVGLGEYSLFFLMLLTFLSIIPLGGGLITIPIGILAIAFGNVWGGVLVLLIHFVVVANIDNVLRPKLIPKIAQLQSALVLLSAFAGVIYFGLLGVIYGPIIMVVITTTIEAYIGFIKSEQPS
ncbi:MAG: AI-2E family transporter [bacterium]|nr:AI-2E family transporter [bacterium]